MTNKYKIKRLQYLLTGELEPVCCKKRTKIVPGQLLVCTLKVLNGTKLILDDHGNNLDSFRISLESFRSFRGPLLHKPVTGRELFSAISYSKPALKSSPEKKDLALGKFLD